MVVVVVVVGDDVVVAMLTEVEVVATMVETTWLVMVATG